MGEAIGALALYAGFRNAAFSVAGPLSAVGSAGFSVLAGLLLGERPGTLAIIGIGLALPAIIGVSVSPGSARPGRGRPGRAKPGRPEPHRDESDQGSPAESRRAGSGLPSAGVIWGLLAGASFALLFIALNRAGGGSGPWPLVASQFTALAVVVCLGAATGEARLPTRHAAGLANPATLNLRGRKIGCTRGTRQVHQIGSRMTRRDYPAGRPGAPPGSVWGPDLRRNPRGRAACQTACCVESANVQYLVR